MTACTVRIPPIESAPRWCRTGNSTPSTRPQGRRDLQWIHSKLRRECGRFIFLCGDSSLDNKHWFFSKEPGGAILPREFSDDARTAPAINGYESVLGGGARANHDVEPRMAMDVNYWFNRIAAEELGPLECCTIMSSVEASNASDRHHFGLLAQDQFIRDVVSEDDTIVMSVGGNDVALAPTWATAVNIAFLTCPASSSCWASPQATATS